MTEAVQQGRRTLLLLALVFLGPLALAAALYFGGYRGPGVQTAAHGEIFEPVRPLADIEATVVEPEQGNVRLHGRWTLIHLTRTGCEAACLEALVATRQVRRALGRDLNRVQRILVDATGETEGATLAVGHPGLAILREPAAVADIFRIAGDSAEGEVFLSDPLGNLLMRYPAGTPMKGMHADLQRLLKISTIG